MPVHATLDGTGKVPVEQLPDGLPGIATWGTIIGTLSAQTDLDTALSGKSSTSHNHSGVYQPVATVLTNTTASFTTAQETKLAGIETAATADMTGAEIVSAIDTALGGTTWQGGGGGGGNTAYAPGNITLAAGNFQLHVKRLQLTTTQRLSLAGTSRFRIT